MATNNNSLIDNTDPLFEKIMKNLMGNLVTVSDNSEIPEKIAFSDEDIKDDGDKSKSLISVYATKEIDEEDVIIKLRMMKDDELLANLTSHINLRYFSELDHLDVFGSSGRFCQNGFGGGSFYFHMNMNNLKHIAHPDYTSNDEKLIYQKRHLVSFEYFNDIGEENEQEYYDYNVENLTIKFDEVEFVNLWIHKLDIDQSNGKVGSSFYDGCGCVTDTNGLIQFNFVDDKIVVDIDDCNDYHTFAIKAFIPIDVYYSVLKEEVKKIKEKKDNEITITKSKNTLSILCDSIPIAHIRTPKDYKGDLKIENTDYFFNLFINPSEFGKESKFREFTKIYTKNFDVSFTDEGIFLNGNPLFTFNENASFIKTLRYKKFNISNGELNIDVLFPTM